MVKSVTSVTKSPKMNVSLLLATCLWFTDEKSVGILASLITYFNRLKISTFVIIFHNGFTLSDISLTENSIRSARIIDLIIEIWYTENVALLTSYFPQGFKARSSKFKVKLELLRIFFRGVSIWPNSWMSFFYFWLRVKPKRRDWYLFDHWII